MKMINDPLSVKRVMGNIKKNNMVNKTFLLVMVPFLTLWNTFYNSIYEQEIYNKMNISFNDIKTIEYNDEYDAMNYIDEVSIGEVIFTGNVDTTKLGKYKVIYVVSDGVVNKEFYNEIEVIDTKSADINIKEEEVSIYVDDDYDVISNIESVYDQVDGELSYKSNVEENDRGYYTVTTDFDKDVVGDYVVNVKAVDFSGNISEKSYTINVKEKIKYTYTYPSYNVGPTVDTSSVVSAAYSFLGYNYTYGGASPETGFDCSGFVYYIYGLFGKSVGRSTSNIIYSGNGVSIDNMSAGDIIVWSTYSDNTPTHATLYVGDGMMIHAANSRQGVILSSVNDWSRNSHIVAIRRV